MAQIAHISDLHFGAASPGAINALVESLNDRQPDLVVVTGDLTQEGRKKEFIEARRFLDKLDAETFVIPGNHDVPVRNLLARFTAPYDRFGRYIAADTNPAYSSEQLKLVGLNSARRAALDINWSYGRLSRKQINNAAAQLSESPPNALKAIAVHHPVIKGPGRAGARTVGRGSEGLRAFVKAGLDIVFTGHVHHSNAQTLQVADRSIVLVQAGTATSIRTRLEPPAYNLITAMRDEIRVSILSFEGGAFNSGKAFQFKNDSENGWRLEL